MEPHAENKRTSKYDAKRKEKEKKREKRKERNVDQFLLLFLLVRGGVTGSVWFFFWAELFMLPDQAWIKDHRSQLSLFQVTFLWTLSPKQRPPLATSQGKGDIVVSWQSFSQWHFPSSSHLPAAATAARGADSSDGSSPRSVQRSSSHWFSSVLKVVLHGNKTKYKHSLRSA